MSALAYLSGIAQGVGEEYSKQAADTRLFKQQKDLATGQALMHEIESNDSLDWPATSALLGQYYKTMGVPDKDAKTLLQHHKGIFDQAQTKQASQPQYQGAPGGSAIPALPGNDSTNPETAAPALPGSGLSTSSLPPLPEYQQPPVNAGQIRATSQAQQQNILTEAQVQKQKELLGLLQNQGAPATSYPNNGSVESNPTPHSKTRQGLVNGQVTYTQTQEQPKYQPQLVYGEDVQKEYPNAVGIVPTNWYKRGIFSDGEVSHYSATPTTTSVVVQDEDSPTKWARVKVDGKNNVIGDPQLGIAPPAGTIGKSSVVNHVERYTDPNTGQVVIKVVPVTNTTTPNIGGSVTPLSPLPEAPKGTAGTSTIPTKAIGAAAKAGLVKPFNERDPVDNVIRMAASDSQLADKEFHKLSKPDQLRYEKRLAELDLTPNNVTNSIRERAIVARGVLSHLTTINGLIDQADRDGDLGVVATRWNDFLSNKVGQDETKSQIFSKLRSEQGFLSTAAAMAHGGLRGGSSPTMVEHWERTLEAKDPKTLRSKMQALTEWMTTYANMVPSSTNAIQGGGRGGITPSSPIPGQTGSDQLPQEFIDKIPEGKLVTSPQGIKFKKEGGIGGRLIPQ